MMKAIHLLHALLLVSPLLAPGFSQTTIPDLVHINETGNCNSATMAPTDVAIRPGSVTSNSAQVSWTALPSLNPEYTYQVLYWSSGSTSFQTMNGEPGLTLIDLTSYTEYNVRVRVICGEGSGPLNRDTVQFMTNSDVPSQIVRNLTATPNFNGVTNLVNIRWSHISDDAWNGGFGGYVIRVYQPSSPISIIQEQVLYPLSEDFQTLEAGNYTVLVTVFNAQLNESGMSARTYFVVGGETQEQLLDYPFVYIIVPGIVFVVIIIVINVIIFKRLHETRRKSVAYCKDIATYQQQGFTNAIPMTQRRSPSSSLSPPNLASPSVVVSSFTNRPLPLSPGNGPSPTMQPHQQFLENEPPAFGNGLATNIPPPKMPHPGPLPQLSESSDPGFAPMHRTMTNQSASSVFSPTSSVPPFTHHSHRSRAVTVGDGMPSPYEIPEHNGSTLSRGDSNAIVRPASASAAQHRAVRGAGNFPPPPMHSPPPLTHSSMELRARIDSRDGMVRSPPGQNTLPRTMSSQQHGGAIINPGSLKHIHSEGHFPIFEEKSDQEKIVHIQPPLDLSVEASIHGESGYPPNGVARKLSPETNMYPYPGGLATNGSVLESEAFSSFAERTESSLPPLGIPRAPQHVPALHEHDRNVPSQNRESLFSETSIELSVSSSSERGVSPGWDHRGAISEVGVGLRRGSSNSPEGRQTVSEVGTGYKAHSHHVFKQV